MPGLLIESSRRIAHEISRYAGGSTLRASAARPHLAEDRHQNSSSTLLLTVFRLGIRHPRSSGISDFGGSSDGGFDLGTDSRDVDEHGRRCVDRITDAIVERHEQALEAPAGRDDIFYSVYGQLHDPSYRKTYAAEPHTMLPRIPYRRGG